LNGAGGSPQSTVGARASSPARECDEKAWKRSTQCGLVPVGTDADFRQQRHLDSSATPAIRRGTASRAQSSSASRHLEHQFVVHLHHHARGPLLARPARLHGDHRQLDEVGRRALHGRVDGLALGAGAARAVAAAN
jgi:hypothetical protein